MPATRIEIPNDRPFTPTSITEVVIGDRPDFNSPGPGGFELPREAPPGLYDIPTIPGNNDNGYRVPTPTIYQ